MWQLPKSGYALKDGLNEGLHPFWQRDIRDIRDIWHIYNILWQMWHPGTPRSEFVRPWRGLPSATVSRAALLFVCLGCNLSRFWLLLGSFSTCKLLHSTKRVFFITSKTNRSTQQGWSGEAHASLASPGGDAEFCQNHLNSWQSEEFKLMHYRCLRDFILE